MRIILDELRRRCQVVDDGFNWVLYGMAISCDVGRILVVPWDSVRAACYYCGFSTQGRYVRQGVDGEVFAVEAMCEPCHAVVERNPSADVLTAVAQRLGVKVSSIRSKAEASAKERAAAQTVIIARARRILPRIPPGYEPFGEAPGDATPVVESSARVESSSARENGGHSDPADLLGTIDDLLEKVTGQRPPAITMKSS